MMMRDNYHIGVGSEILTVHTCVRRTKRLFRKYTYRKYQDQWQLFTSSIGGEIDDGNKDTVLMHGTTQRPASSLFGTPKRVIEFYQAPR